MNHHYAIKIAGEVKEGHAKLCRRGDARLRWCWCVHHIYTFLLASICVLLWLCDKLLHGAFRWPMCSLYVCLFL